jgi:hypothetical protein
MKLSDLGLLANCLGMMVADFVYLLVWPDNEDTDSSDEDEQSAEIMEVILTSYDGEAPFFADYSEPHRRKRHLNDLRTTSNSGTASHPPNSLVLHILTIFIVCLFYFHGGFFAVLPGSYVPYLVFYQLFFSSVIIHYLSTVLSTWGLSTYSLLFLASPPAKSLFQLALSPEWIDYDDGPVFNGALVSLLHSCVTSKDRLWTFVDSPNGVRQILMCGISIGIIALVCWLRCRPLESVTERRRRSTDSCEKHHREGEDRYRKSGINFIVVLDCIN